MHACARRLKEERRIDVDDGVRSDEVEGGKCVTKEGVGGWNCSTETA